MGGQSRWLAICSDEACGHIEVHAADLTAPSDGLRTFLLGKRPTQAYVAPWVRFFVQVQRSYVAWTANGAVVSGLRPFARDGHRHSVGPATSRRPPAGHAMSGLRRAHVRVLDRRRAHRGLPERRRLDRAAHPASHLQASHRRAQHTRQRGARRRLAMSASGLQAKSSVGAVVDVAVLHSGRSAQGTNSPRAFPWVEY